MSEPPATPDDLATLYLRARDVPCPGCGYNRRDGTAAACPECHVSVHFSDDSADRWLSLSKRRSEIIAWSLLLLCIVYWFAYCATIWETIQIIAVDMRPWNLSWYILNMAASAPFVACLPLAAWQLISLIRHRSRPQAHMPNEQGILLYRAFRWCVIAVAPWTLYLIGEAIWRLTP